MKKQTKIVVGVLIAVVAIGVFFREGVQKDAKTQKSVASISGHEKGCNNGDMKSCGKLGFNHIKSDDPERHKKGAILLEQSCLNGEDGYVCYRFGKMLLFGWGGKVEKSTEKAIAMFKKGCEHDGSNGKSENCEEYARFTGGKKYGKK